MTKSTSDFLLLLFLDFQTLKTRISKRNLDGSEVTLEQVEQTDSVLLENMHPGTSPDLLTLYFEGERGGNQRVKEVTMLSEGTAKVTFAYYECKLYSASPSDDYIFFLTKLLCQAKD